MIYYLMIKSHSDAPDIERDVQASSKEEAVNFFYEWLNKYGWDIDTISRNVVAESEFTV